MGESDIATADAAVVAQPGRVAVVLTADCMPLLLCDEAGTRVAVAHAGWRGMAAGVIEGTIRSMDVAPSRLVAWMGPTIGPQVFEVGPEVRDAFMAVDREADVAFRAHKPGKYLADLYQLARQRLARAGVAKVSGGGFCTYTESDRFFSYRRVRASGRMGTFIWIEAR
jgi:YfiH family protein